MLRPSLESGARWTSCTCPKDATSSPWWTTAAASWLPPSSPSAPPPPSAAPCPLSSTASLSPSAASRPTTAPSSAAPSPSSSAAWASATPTSGPAALTSMARWSGRSAQCGRSTGMASARGRWRSGSEACKTTCASTTGDGCTAPWATWPPWRMLCSAYLGPGSLTCLETLHPPVKRAIGLTKSRVISRRDRVGVRNMPDGYTACRVAARMTAFLSQVECPPRPAPPSTARPASAPCRREAVRLPAAHRTTPAAAPPGGCAPAP